MKNKIFTKLLSITLVCVMLVMSMGAYGGKVSANVGLQGNEYLETETDGVYLRGDTLYSLDAEGYLPVGSMELNLSDENAVQSVLNDDRISSSMKDSICEKKLLAQNNEIQANIKIFSYDLLPKTKSYINEGPFAVDGTRMKSEWMTFAMTKTLNEVTAETDAIADAKKIYDIVFNCLDKAIDYLLISPKYDSIFDIFLDSVNSSVEEYIEAFGSFTRLTLDYDITEKHTLVESYYGSDIWEYKLLTNRLYIKKRSLFMSFFNRETGVHDNVLDEKYPLKYFESESFNDPYERCKTIGSGPLVENIFAYINDKSFLLT